MDANKTGLIISIESETLLKGEWCHPQKMQVSVGFTTEQTMCALVYIWVYRTNPLWDWFVNIEKNHIAEKEKKV